MGTERQNRALIIYVENHGKSLSDAMRQAGYSDATAKNPKQLRDSQAWQEFFDEHVSDESLVDIHKNLLQAKTIEHMVFPLWMDPADIRQLLLDSGCTPQKIKAAPTATHVWYWAPDNAARSTAMALAYKLKGRLTNKIEVADPDGLFGTNALTIKVVDGPADADAQSEATASA